MNQLEEMLCKTYHKKYGVFTGNGTTAMYLGFKALGMQDKKVIFPAISCTNPVNAAIFAGYEVDFCDVTLEDYTMDVQQLKAMLSTGEYGIVVPTHIYGHRFSKELYDMCREYKVTLFEDAAQTDHIGDSDVSILSFGHTKLCETEHGGGIIFTDNASLLKKMRQHKKELPVFPENAKELFDTYRQDYYRIVQQSSSMQEKNTKLKALQLASKAIFIYDMDENTEVYDKIKNMASIKEDRNKKSALYEQLLDKALITLPKTSYDTEVLWRFTFLYNGNRDYLLETARKHNIDISSWYPSLSLIYKNENLPNASVVQDKVVNLWVDETHSLNQIESEINTLNTIMREDNHGSK